MKWPVCVVVVLLVCASVDFCDATVCRPLSKFTIDCNTCRCDHSGLEYSCTNQICEPQEDRYIKEITKEGYVLLRPRESYQKKLLDEPVDADDDFVLPRIRHHRVAYVNDEIDPRREENDIDGGFRNSALMSAVRNVHSAEDDQYVDDIELNDEIQK